MKTFFLAFMFIFFNVITSAQLSKGDIAFIGYNTDAGPGASEDHSFSFIALNDIPASEVIYFTEEGWDDVLNTWAGTTEGHLAWVAPVGGLSCGSIVYVTEIGSDVLSVTGGGTISIVSGSGWNLSGGDQVLAYQALTPEPGSTPNFIAGINGDDGNGSPVSFNTTTKWNDPNTGALGTAKSGLPFGLTNGVNCVSLFVEVFTEQDNAKYNGSLTGTAMALRAAINDRGNWVFNDNTALNISAGGYPIPNVNCATVPVELIQFDAEKLNDGVQLYWKTASEWNNEKFEIEESQDGITFEKIGELNGHASTSEIKEYQFKIEKSIIGNLYYRLKQIDYDGRYEYSDIRKVNYDAMWEEKGMFFPNPAQNGNVYLHYVAHQDGEIIISVFDMAGKLYHNELKTVSKGNKQYDFDFSALESGIYNIRLDNGRKLIHQKLIIE